MKNIFECVDLAVLTATKRILTQRVFIVVQLGNAISEQNIRDELADKILSALKSEQSDQLSKYNKPDENIARLLRIWKTCASCAKLD